MSALRTATATGARSSDASVLVAWLRPEERRCTHQNLIRTREFTFLLFEFTHPSLLVGRDSYFHAVIDDIDDSLPPQARTGSTP